MSLYDDDRGYFCVGCQQWKESVDERSEECPDCRREREQELAADRGWRAYP